MKKIFVFILCTAILLVSCGTKGAENRIDSNDRVQSDVGFISSRNAFFRDGNMLYTAVMCKGGVLLSSYDIKSKEAKELCGKEDCEHNDFSCDALMQSLVYGLIPDGDKIRWISAENKKLWLFQANTDGTDKQSVKEIPSDGILSLNSQFSILYYNDSVYYSGVSGEYKNHNPVQVVKLGEESFSESDGSKLLLENTYSNMPYVYSFVSSDGIYTVISSNEKNRKGEAEPKLEVYKLTDGSKKVKKVYSGACSIYAYNADMYGGDIYLSEYLGTRIYKFEIEKKKFSLVADISEKYSGFNVSYVSGGRIIANSTKGGLCCVMDYSGNELLYADYSEFEDTHRDSDGFLGRYFIGTDNDYLYYSYCEETKYAAIPLNGDKPILIFDNIQ